MTEVRAAARGDRAAFEGLVRRHAGAVAAVTLAVTGDPVLAREAAQDAFVLAWRRLPTLDDPDAFGPWLRQIARNRARDLLRSARRTEERTAALDVEAVPAGEGPEDRLAAAEDARRIRACLEALPEPAREVLVLYYREELPTAELAARLGVSEAAVRQRLHRAREQLRAEVELRDALRRTAPGAAFVLGVLAALPSPAEAREARPRRRVGRWVLAATAPALVLGWLGLGAAPADRAPPAPRPPPASDDVPVQRVAPARTRLPEVALPSATDEAYAALAEVTDRIAVRCPAEGLPPDPEGPDELRVLGQGAWFLANAPRGAALVERRVALATAEVEGVGEVLTATRTEGPPAVVRWDPAGCRVEEARPVRLVARAEGAEVEGVHGCDGVGEVRAYDGVPCVLVARAEDVEGRLTVTAREGLEVEVPLRPASEPLSLTLDEVMDGTFEDLFAEDGRYGRALASPGLSEEARALILGWQDQGGDDAAAFMARIEGFRTD